MWIQACGLIHSTLVIVPWSLIGFSTSNSPAKEWCAKPGAAAPESMNSAMADTKMSRMSVGSFSQLSVQHLFRERHALEFEELRVLFLPAVERRGDLPRPSEDLKVLDGGLVLNEIRSGGGVALDHVQGLAVKIAGPIEPRLVDEAGHVDHQRIAVPPAARPAHPVVGGAIVHLVHVDQPAGTRERVGNDDLVRPLDDLKRKRHVRGPRHARHVALRLGIQLPSLREVLLLFRRGPGL